MIDYKMVESVDSSESLVSFINILKEDYKRNKDDWEGKTIEDYLDSVTSWLEDMDGFYSNTNKKLPKNIDWSFIATLFLVGKLYE